MDVHCATLLMMIPCNPKSNACQMQEEGDLQSAIACYELALSMDVHHTIPCHAALLLMKACNSETHVCQMQEEGDLQSAIACYELALSMDVHYAKSSLSLGALYKNRGGPHDRTLAQVCMLYHLDDTLDSCPGSVFSEQTQRLLSGQ